MRKVLPLATTLLAAGLGCSRATRTPETPYRPRLTGQVLIEYDSSIARREAGPHNGGGETTSYPFFADAPGLGLIFRKRALHPGSAIGYHPNESDEIYYVLSGRGEFTMNGVSREVGPGTAILTRPGVSHGLRQIGSDDLVILISYLREDGR